MSREGSLSFLPTFEREKEESFHLNNEVSEYLKSNVTMDLYANHSSHSLSYVTIAPFNYRYEQGFHLAFNESASTVEQTYLALHAASHIVLGDLLERESIIEYPPHGKKEAFTYDAELLNKHQDALYLTESLLKAEHGHNWDSTNKHLMKEMGQRWANRATYHLRELHSILTNPEYRGAKKRLIKRTEQERKSLPTL